MDSKDPGNVGMFKYLDAEINCLLTPAEQEYNNEAGGNLAHDSTAASHGRCSISASLYYF